MSCCSLWRSLVCALLWTALAGSSLGQVPIAHEQAPSAGQAAYRSGDYASAKAHWSAALDQATSSAQRGSLLHNLGNAAFREDNFLEAVARYTAAIEHAPRQSDTWANLELSRSRAGLDAADRGDFAATVERLYSILRLPELELVTYGALALLGLALLGEALRGGRFTRFLGVVFLGLALGLGALHTWRAEHTPAHRAMVTASGGVGLRSEPDLGLPVILRVDGGGMVERVDSLPGWLRVRVDSTMGWIEAKHILEIDQD
ncbi:MAG: hypothetical protein ACI84E_000478 [Planctomycetota bacterium]|jgi:hypothetical protein